MSEKIYPSWRYHKEQGAKLIQNAEQESQLQGVWQDTPVALAYQASAEIKNQGDENSEMSEKPAKTPRKSKKDAE